ncbi:MAG: phosphopyruvate hydratase [Candidatus Levyibacteriota bacterium]|nr:MAG: phosphopyruvate hydratase [Candidatus Levybacteria bacterium]
MAKIKQVFAREILDSRGNPTIETTVILEDGSVGTASCPSGASTGMHEAVELRDNDNSRYNGKGVLQAVSNIENIVGPQLIGKEAGVQKDIDAILTALDGTPNKAKLGANTILSASIAVAKAQSVSEKIPIYRYIQRITGNLSVAVPTPFFNILNGGKHAGENIDFQEFIVIPNRQTPFSKGLEQAVSVYFSLKKLLEQNHLSILVGDEGGFGPVLSNNKAALSFIKQAIEQTQLVFAKDMSVGLDVAASSFYKDGKYILKENPNGASASELIALYTQLNNEYRFLFLEDALAEDDWDNWTQLASALSGKETIVVGDDLLVTNPERLKLAIEKKAATGIIIKPNQIGTISEAIAVAAIAKQANIKTVVSHRSGETNDDFIADFAVGINADFVKFGAPARGERVAKYNRLLKIESELTTT